MNPSRSIPDIEAEEEKLWVELQLRRKDYETKRIEWFMVRHALDVAKLKEEPNEATRS